MTVLRVALASGLITITAMAATNVTFNKDVLPILQNNCQECHRAGEIAPMSLMTYTEARPWAKAIKIAVVSQKMPPWFADPKIGHFANDRRLNEAQIQTLTAWVDNGAPEGDTKDKPAPRKFQEGWNLKPDMVISVPNAFQLPATGTIDYQYILVKGNITEDLWVKQAEMRPSNNAVLHHGKVWVRPPGSHWMEHATPGVPYSTGMGKNTADEGNDIIGKYNPGLGAQNFEIDGSAKLIPKGSDFVFELHYTTIGKPASDTARVGLVLAKSAPVTRYYTSPGTPAALNLVIPANESNVEVASESTVGADVRLVYIQPHAHLRGKDFEIRVVYPTGEKETIFKGKFDFNWQLGYDLAKPLVLPKGTKIVSIAHYDNSANNPSNPDPTKEVHWGPQNWDEMQSVFLGFIFPVDTNIATVLKASGPSLLPRPKTGGGPTLAALDVK
ncbi:MAG TPA: thiol-disulfide isomerase [Bryobacteraceae bacterium]|nr:thiol-disulfide isomerase [Bryobacteraceae bacterium]